jgi:hypothetical protein
MHAFANSFHVLMGPFRGLAGELVNVLREAGQNVPSDLLKFGTHVKKKACNCFSLIFFLLLAVFVLHKL